MKFNYKMHPLSLYFIASTKWRGSEIQTWKCVNSADWMKVQGCFWNNEAFSIQVALSGWNKQSSTKNSLRKATSQSFRRKGRSPHWHPELLGHGARLPKITKRGAKEPAPEGWRTERREWGHAEIRMNDCGQYLWLRSLRAPKPALPQRALQSAAEGSTVMFVPEVWSRTH